MHQQRETRTTSHGRIGKDLKEVNDRKNLDSPPIYASPVEDNLDHLDALIVGPPETPYAFGFYRFDMRFPATYPNTPPKVLITTTNGGRTRFNPNLYAAGKVCLSILGTWSGESEDEWRSCYSINYILSAIQSLIMTADPYYNEPGYEQGSGEHDPAEVKAYSEKIKHENLRIAVCGMVETAIHGRNNPWNEIIKHHFVLWYDNYIDAVTQEGDSKEGQEFAVMPFEFPENTACGKFNYHSILARLKESKETLDKETEEWKEKGKALTKKEEGSKYYRLLEESDKIKSGKVVLDGMSAAPVDEGNLYHWNASIFGPDGSAWEGGFYNLEIVFSDDDAPPRVRFLTEVFHPHVNSDGVPYIVVPQNSREVVVTILNACAKLLAGAPNSSPATWANPEAARMYFSKDEEVKKEYKKRVSRCVRRSVEG